MDDLIKRLRSAQVDASQRSSILFDDAVAALAALSATVEVLTRQRDGARDAYMGLVDPTQEWQPIETAPRDGTTVLLWAPAWQSPRTGWTFAKDPWQDAGFGHHLPGREPTHWKPVSPPNGLSSAPSDVKADRGDDRG